MPNFTPKTFATGREAYEDDLARAPRYHDGGPRPSWAELGDFGRRSWDRNPTRRPLSLDELTVGRRYVVGSGMGGTFDAVLVKIDNGLAHWRVDMPLNPDWHRHRFTSDGKDVRHTL